MTHIDRRVLLTVLGGCTAAGALGLAASGASALPGPSMMKPADGASAAADADAGEGGGELLHRAQYYVYRRRRRFRRRRCVYFVRRGRLWRRCYF